MANRQRGEITYRLGTKRYTLRLTTNAVCELEDFTAAQTKLGLGNGRTWDQVLQGIDRGSLKDLRLFFWVALREHHPEIATDDPASLKTIGTLIDEAGGALAVVKQVSKLLEANAAEQGKDDDQKEDVPKAERPPDAQAGIGDGSSPTH